MARLLPQLWPVEKILVACALEKELEVLRSGLPKRLQFLRTGLGCRGSCRQLEKKIRSAPPGAIIFAGTAGQLSPSVTSREVIFPERWCFPDGQCYRQSSRISSSLAASGFPPCGVGLTVQRPIITGEARRRLHHETGALVCDMESAGILSLAQKFEVPTVAIKVVSDTAESGIACYWEEFSENLRLLTDYLGGVIRVLSTGLP